MVERKNSVDNFTERLEMPLDSGLLYGEMFGSYLLHVAAVGVIANLIMPLFSDKNMMYFIALCIVASILINFICVLILQWHTCGAVTDWLSIATSAIRGAIITGLFIAIPIKLESFRLMISTLLVEHVPIVGTPVDEKSTVKLLEPDEYANQTFKETWIGAAYMAAFAGAYGVGLGAYFSLHC
jgi:hypothetical protein